MNRTLGIALGVCWPLVCLAAGGCSSDQNGGKTGDSFATPGQYSAAPAGVVRPRVGIPVPAVTIVEGAAAEVRSDEAAAEQLFWVADRSGRFNLIERIELAQMIQSQGLNGMFIPGELVHPARLQGINYVLVCRITDLQVRGSDQPTTLSVGGVEKVLHVGHAKPSITTQATVELRLIDPATGKAAAQVRDSFARTCSPAAMGLEFPDPDAAWGTLHLNSQQMGQVLRIVLDDAMRKFIPGVDRLLARTPALANQEGMPATNRTTRPSVTPSQTTSAKKIRCPECGNECLPEDEFCPNCGARLHPASGTPHQ